MSPFALTIVSLVAPYQLKSTSDANLYSNCLQIISQYKSKLRSSQVKLLLSLYPFYQQVTTNSTNSSTTTNFVYSTSPPSKSSIVTSMGSTIKPLFDFVEYFLLWIKIEPDYTILLSFFHNIIVLKYVINV